MKLKHTLSISIFAMSLFALNANALNIAGTKDPTEPKKLSTYFTGTINDQLVWKGVSGETATTAGDAYLLIDGTELYKFNRFVISGSSGGQCTDMNVTFAQGAQIQTINADAFSFNDNDIINVDANFALAEGATSATWTMNGFSVDQSAGTDNKKSNLSFGKGLQITSGSFSVTSDGSRKITMDSDWVVTSTKNNVTFVDANAEFGGNFTAASKTSLTATKLNVTGAYQDAGITTFDKDSTLTIAEGATYTSTGTESTLVYGKLNINGKYVANGGFQIQKQTIEVTSYSGEFALGENAEILSNGTVYSRNGGFELNANQKLIITTDATAATNLASLHTASVVTVGANAELSITTENEEKNALKAYNAITIDGKLTIVGGKNIQISRIGMTINSGADKVSISDVDFLLGVKDIVSTTGGSKLTVNTSNNFNTSSILTSEGYTDKGTAHSNTSFLVLGKNVEVSFKGIGFFIDETHTDTLEITLNEGTKLILNDLIDTSATGFGNLGAEDRIIIKNFDENRFGLKNYNKDVDDALLSQIQLNGVSDQSNLHWQLGLDGNYWLSNIAVVPEPAEWAAIFGAIALAFAAYRRRIK